MVQHSVRLSLRCSILSNVQKSYSSTSRLGYRSRHITERDISLRKERTVEEFYHGFVITKGVCTYCGGSYEQYLVNHAEFTSVELIELAKRAAMNSGRYTFYTPPESANESLMCGVDLDEVKIRIDILNRQIEKEFRANMEEALNA